MVELMKIGFPLLLLVLVGYYAFRQLQSNKTRENYFFFSGVLLAFVIVYCVSVLGYRITGSNVSIEEARREINASKKEISNVTETLVKMAAIIADGSRRFGGIPKPHLEQIEKYKTSLQEYLKPDLDKEIQATIHGLDLQIEHESKK